MDNQTKRTTYLNQPLTPFRNPLSHAKQPSTSRILTVHLFLSNGQVITISPDTPVILGRGTSSLAGERKIDLTSISNKIDGVSRDHVSLELKGDLLYIKDHQSTNGTFLNKTELYPMRNYVVQDGDVLMLGNTEIKVKFVVSDS